MNTQVLNELTIFYLVFLLRHLLKVSNEGPGCQLVDCFIPHIFLLRLAVCSVVKKGLKIERDFPLSDLAAEQPRNDCPAVEPVLLAARGATQRLLRELKG